MEWSTWDDSGCRVRVRLFKSGSRLRGKSGEEVVMLELREMLVGQSDSQELSAADSREMASL